MTSWDVKQALRRYLLAQPTFYLLYTRHMQTFSSLFHQSNKKTLVFPAWINSPRIHMLLSGRPSAGNGQLSFELLAREAWVLQSNTGNCHCFCLIITNILNGSIVKDTTCFGHKTLRNHARTFLLASFHSTGRCYTELWAISHLWALPATLPV